MVADVGGQLGPDNRSKFLPEYLDTKATVTPKIARTKPDIEVTADINHANAGDMFKVKLGSTGKSSLQILLDSLQEKVK